MRTLAILICIALLVGAFGCDAGAPTPPNPTPPTEKPLVQQPLAQPGGSAAGVQPSKRPEPVREKAAVGMGEKGRGYGGAGMVATPVHVLWSIKEQLVLDQIHQALQLYRATDPNGRGPKSHEEFLEKIIEPNNIRLPELPPGERYYFDPAAGELMVEKPDAE